MIRELKFLSMCGMILVAIPATVTLADGIPQPDVVVWGTVTIDGTQATATDDVTVIARADGVANPVGRYKMGDLDAAADRYYLTVRVETVVPDTTPSGAAVQFTPGGPAQTVRLFVQQGAGAEVEVPPVLTVSNQGTINQRDFVIGSAATPGDCDGDGDVDLVDFGAFQLCFTGGVGILDPGCECADFDGDSDVDLVDFGAFQLAFTGSTL